MKPEDCPKFDGCSANKCPLDEKWRTRPHMNGEAICFYLLESVKVGAEERFKDRDDKWIYEAAKEMKKEPEYLTASLRYELTRSAQRGSKIDQGHRLKNL